MARTFLVQSARDSSESGVTTAGRAIGPRSRTTIGAYLPARSTALIAFENIPACAPSGGLMRP